MKREKMLRRFHFASSLCGTRRVITYSEENAALAAASKARGWSNTWITEGELVFLGLPLPSGPTTQVTVCKRFDVVNVDACHFHPMLSQLPDVFCHTNALSGMPLPTDVQEALSERAHAAGWRRRHWVRTSDLKSNSIRVNLYDCGPEKRSPFVVLLRDWDCALFNATQLEKPDALLRKPIGGGKKFWINGPLQEHLEAAMASRGWKNGLFFSRQATLDIGLEVDPDSEPVRWQRAEGYSAGNEPFERRWYNADQLEGGAEVLRTLGRVGNPPSPTLLFRGAPVRDERTAHAMRAAGFTSNFWEGADELAFKSCAPRAGETPLIIRAAADDALAAAAYDFYNVAQLVAPERGFQLAGTCGV